MVQGRGFICLRGLRKVSRLQSREKIHHGKAFLVHFSCVGSAYFLLPKPSGQVFYYDADTGLNRERAQTGCIKVLRLLVSLAPASGAAAIK